MRRAIPGDNDDREILLLREPALRDQHVERIAHALRARGCGGHRGVQPGGVKRRKRKHREQRQAPGGVDEDHMRPECLVK